MKLCGEHVIRKLKRDLSHPLLPGHFGAGIGITGDLIYSDAGDGVNVILHEPFVVQSRGYTIEAPAGMKTNFASIPWIFRRIFPCFGPWNVAAIPHDFIWEHALALGLSRNEADLIYLDICWRRGVRVRGLLMWLGLFVGGWPKWFVYRWKEAGRFCWWKKKG